jgi:alpha/beta superfamily hydrolase
MNADDLPFPERPGPLRLSGPAGVIEAMVDLPEPGEGRAGVAIVCHPHPLHGGTMHNKVVTMLERALRESGLATVRFNFRGVGESEGEYDEGRGETQDCIAVAEWLMRSLPDHQLWLAGFSFGAYVAARAAQTLPVKFLISVAPPVGNWDFESLARPDCPWLVIQGSEDDVSDPEAVRDFVARHESPPQLVEIPETGHFFHRRLMDLRGAVKNGVKAHLPPLKAEA